MLATQLSTFVISVMHSDRDAEVDIVSNALTVANTFPMALLGVEKTPTCWFFFFGTSIRHFTTSCIGIPIPVKRLLISKSPSSYSVMSWHIPILQCIPFVAVISHQGCILLDHVQYYKNFCKIKNSEIYWGSFYLHQTEKTYCKLERKFYFFCQVARERKLLMSFLYINIMRKYHDRFNISWSSLTHFRCCTAACAFGISSDTRVEGGLYAGFLKMELAADKTSNNANPNDQTISTTRAVKSS